MDTQEILHKASVEVSKMANQTFDILEIKKPHSKEFAEHLAKVISKISPLLGNMIEFSVVEQLNKSKWNGQGQWQRQDPGFPDAIFKGDVNPAPGIEIKTWFPLATEITARFKDSIFHFDENQTNVAVLAWLPEFILYGKPKIIDVWVGSGRSLAEARDRHYHRPPDYLVLEPEDTTERTANLQQTNTNGYKFQGNAALLKKAENELKRWNKNWMTFDASPEYQSKMKSLLGRYPYRLDTNFAKIDRIEHAELEVFKSKVLSTTVHGKTIQEWSKLVGSDTSELHQLVSDLI